MNIRVYYEDTDCAGLVYYANYLKYFERARTAFLEERGVSVAELLERGVQFLVVHAQLDYRAPARYGDRLLVETWIADRTKASISFAHQIHEEKSGRLIVEGSARLVATALSGTIMRLPREILTMAMPSSLVRSHGTTPASSCAQSTNRRAPSRHG